MNSHRPGLHLPELIEDADFDFVRNMVKEHTAIALDNSKVYLVNARLLPVARDAGFSSVIELIRHLRSRPFGPLHSRTVESIVTTETSFFRDFYPFEALRQVLIPEIMERRRRSTRLLSIWSAGCSGGQEPYSLAILLRDSFPELANWQVRLFASDVSSAMLEKSKAGIYSQNEINRGLPARLLVRYFNQTGTSWKISDEIRSMVTFSRHNLARDVSAAPPVDILMMRNVLIYFDVDTKRKVLQRVRRHLRPGGYLMLGTAETTLNLDEDFQRYRVDQAVFYRNGDPEVR